MKKKEFTRKSNQKELSHLMSKPFSDSEKTAITAARKKIGTDRPIFYHDAVVDYAKRINGEEE